MARASLVLALLSVASVRPSIAWQSVPRSSKLHRHGLGRSSHLLATGGGGGDSAGADPVVLLPLMEAELAATSDDDGDESRRRTLEGSISDTRIAAEFGVRRPTRRLECSTERASYSKWGCGSQC